MLPWLPARKDVRVKPGYVGGLSGRQYAFAANGNDASGRAGAMFLENTTFAAAHQPARSRKLQPRSTEDRAALMVVRTRAAGRDHAEDNAHACLLYTSPSPRDS